MVTFNENQIKNIRDVIETIEIIKYRYTGGESFDSDIIFNFEITPQGWIETIDGVHFTNSKLAKMLNMYSKSTNCGIIFYDAKGQDIPYEKLFNTSLKSHSHRAPQKKCNFVCPEKMF